MKCIFFLLTLMLMAFSTRAFSCSFGPEWEGTPGFRFIRPQHLDGEAYARSQTEESIEFWYHYVGGAARLSDVEQFVREATYTDVTEGEWNANGFWRLMSQSRYAQARQLLLLNLQLSSIDRWAWDYEETAPKVQASVLQQVDRITTLPSNLRPRWVYLKIRLLYQQKRFSECQQLIQANRTLFRGTGLERRVRGYEAGLMFQNGQYCKALEIYHELGDDNSVSCCLDRLVGFDGIRQLNAADPNSVALKYVLQDFANYYEYSSPYAGWDSEVGKRTRSDAAQVKAYARQQVGNQRCTTPQMWMSMLAWMEWVEGDYVQALKDAQAALKLRGTDEMTQNTQRIVLLCSIANAPLLADEVSQNSIGQQVVDLYDRALREFRSYDAEQENYDICGAAYNYCFVMGVLDEQMDAYFDARHMQESKLVFHALLAQLDGYRTEDGTLVNDYSSEFFRTLDNDSTSVDQALSIREILTRRTTSQWSVTRQLVSRVQANEMVLNDLLGTKCMRMGEYARAVQFLQCLTPAYVHSTNVFPYLVKRTYKPYSAFVRTQYEEHFDVENFSAQNYKLEFCQRVLNMQKQAANQSGEQQAQTKYRLAGLLFQASINGDLWALGSFDWSTCSDPYDRFSAQARQLIDEAIQTSKSPEMLQRCHYARLSIPSRDNVWSLDYDWQGGRTFYNFEVTGAATQSYAYLNTHRTPVNYVSSCEVLTAYLMRAY